MKKCEEGCVPKGGLRSTARFLAVQMMYRAMISEITISTVIKEALKQGEVILSEDISVSEIDFDFFRLLLETTDKHLERIDSIISENLSVNWKIERLDNVMKSVLRLGTAELLYLDSVPPNVVFNEYIEISKSFFEKSEVAFVNGLLNSVFQRYPRNQNTDS